MIRADADAIARIVRGEATLPAALRSRRVQVTGDRAALARFVALFPLPDVARVAALAA